MLRKFAFLGLFIYSFGSNSQTLTQSANEPAIGDISTYYPMDTSLFTTGLPISVTGSTSVWDFTKLKSSQPLVTDNYVSPSTTTASASYTGCTVVQSNGGLFTYIKSTTTPTTQTEVLGLTSTTLALTFTNSAVVVKYPVSYGSSFTDNIAGSYVYSISGTCSGNIVTTADGLGTLNLPGSVSLTNVLRVKSVQTLTLTYLVIPVATLKQTIYNYYHASKKFSIVSVNYTSLAATGQTPSLSGFVTGNSAYFTAPPPTGINESLMDEKDVALYPNPSQGFFNLELTNPGSEKSNLEIYAISGQLVRSFDLGNASIVKELITTNGLNKGIYFVKINTGDKAVVKKLFVE